MSNNDQVRVKSPEDARQGRTGVGMRYVLVGGIILALIAWVIIAFLVR